MKILVIDVGGTQVKFKLSTQTQSRAIESGLSMSAADMVRAVKERTADWTYDVVAIGYPGPVMHGRIPQEPHNLASGWVGFDFESAFGCPVRLINDAAMRLPTVISGPPDSPSSMLSCSCCRGGDGSPVPAAASARRQAACSSPKTIES